MQTKEHKDVGKTFNHLKVLEISGKNKYNKLLALCQCNLCGTKKAMVLTEVRNGYSKSCGCLSRKVLASNRKKHGMSGTKVHRAWKGMKQRCNNPSYDHYERYGGRGITYSKEWEEFEKFYEDMGEPPSEKYQLDRINNDGNYCKENCRWVLPKDNCNNRTQYKNKTGFTGVVENTSKKGRYSSYFNVNRKHVYVGTFDSPEEAYKARIEAIKKYNLENNANLKFIELDDYHK